MITIAVCDDDPAFAGELAGKIYALLPDAEVKLFSGAGELSACMETGPAPDVAFVDIRLGDADGIDLVKRLFEGRDTRVIYVTAYVEYCSDVYETEHSYFLTKPVTDEKLENALRKAVKELGMRRNTVALAKKGSAARIPADDILFFESSYRKVTAHTDSREITVYSTLAGIMEMTDERFVQCHKSFLVNLNRVSSMEPAYFVMDNGAHVPISRGMAAGTRKKFFAFLEG
jgi:DNA-binding LytR/AlgR family response regulator